jgi:hypothetical protein
VNFQIDNPNYKPIRVSRAEAKEAVLTLMDFCIERIFYVGGWCVAQPIMAYARCIEWFGRKSKKL